MDVPSRYLTWPKVVELCKDSPISGLQEMRRGALMDVDKDTLGERMRIYLDTTMTWGALKSLHAGLTEDGGRFNAQEARAKITVAEKYDSARLTRYALYPFDLRWCYKSAIRPLWNEPRPALAMQQWPGNQFIVTRMIAERPNEGAIITSTSALPDYHLLRPNAVAIPIRLRQPTFGNASAIDTRQATLLALDKAIGSTPTANLSPTARIYLNEVGITNPDIDVETAELIWMHVLAIGHSPSYLLGPCASWGKRAP